MTLLKNKYFCFIRLFVVILFSASELFSQNILFDHLTTSNGLSNNVIYSVIQDKLGYLWFGTEDGLNRYDGYNFKVYRHQPGNANSLSDYAATRLYEDNDGIIWVGTRQGLNRFDPSTQTFTHFKKNTDFNSISDDNITSIYEDSKGTLWIGTVNGLNILDRKTNSFRIFKSEPSNPKSLSSNQVREILEDKSGNIWIGTLDGLNLFNHKDSSFLQIKNDPGNSSSISSNIITELFSDSKGNLWVGSSSGINKLISKHHGEFKIKRFDNIYNNLAESSSNRIAAICEDSDGLLWIGTIGGGIIILDEKNNDFKIIKHQPENSSSLSSDEIRTIIKDNSDVIWIGTYSHGINKYVKERARFNNFKVDHSELKSNANNVSSVFLDDAGLLWVGTYGKGIHVFRFEIADFKKGIVSFNPISITSLQQLNNQKVTSILKDKYGILWIGTFGGGLFTYNPESDKLKAYQYSKSNPKSISSNFIHTILEDSDGNIWIGTGQSGLLLYDRRADTFFSFKHNPNDSNSVSSNEITAIFEDDGLLWIGTSTKGLNKFKRIKKTFRNYQKSSDDFNSISSQRIETIFQDNKGKIWVGTFAGGLNEFDKAAEKFFSYNTKNGLAGNTVFAITEDKSGNLWLSTDKGISKFDPVAKTFRNFNEDDGVQGDEFNPRAYFYDKINNLIFFGSTNGLNIFNPDLIFDNKTPPRISFTDFQIFNNSVLVKNSNDEEKSVAYSDEVVLTASSNVFSIEFAALHYSNPEKNSYAYKMEGFDADWTYSNRRFVTYTNLDPGTYIFKVKASNGDGIWNEEPATIRIIISPPWWRTGWAYAGYVLFILIGLFAIRKFEKNRIKLRNEIKMHEFESNKLREVEAMKSRFFANLSHEFRTPLMLIKGPVEQLINSYPEGKLKEQLQMVGRNTENLQKLIDQLLELSQLESASIPLKAKEENLVTNLVGLTYSFESLAKQKDIQLSFVSEFDSVFAWIDRDKFEKIINNILSNAFKFTNEGGKVTVELSKIESDNKLYAQIEIKDTGVGIQDDKLDKIFDRFYQIDDSARKNYAGSGIGLALVKELVELHKWNISVKSKLNEGSTFILTIPLWDYLSEKDKIINSSTSKIKATEQLKVNETFPEDVVTIEHSDIVISKLKPTILIVEDSEDVRNYLSDMLFEKYNVIEAKNGSDGIESARLNSPDLIMSDIMMPVMDGIEFCRRIKSDWETSHIPVILLTAKVSRESKLEGLETGADDYLTKPFDSRELFIRINNLLQQRICLREKFSKEFIISPETITTNAVDNEFISRAMSVIEKNLANPEYTAEDLAKDMFVSLSQLRRKLTAITGQAPGEFLRTYRLKRAAQMILENKLSITQITFEVGFSSPSHFSKAFKQQFNCLPSEFSSNNTPVN